MTDIPLNSIFRVQWLIIAIGFTGIVINEFTIKSLIATAFTVGMLTASVLFGINNQIEISKQLKELLKKK